MHVRAIPLGLQQQLRQPRHLPGGHGPELSHGGELSGGGSSGEAGGAWEASDNESVASQRPITCDMQPGSCTPIKSAAACAGWKE